MRLNPLTWPLHGESVHGAWCVVACADLCLVIDRCMARVLIPVRSAMQRLYSTFRLAYRVYLPAVFELGSAFDRNPTLDLTILMATQISTPRSDPDRTQS